MGTAGTRPIRVVYVDHVARMSGGEIALLRALSALGPSVDAHVILGEDGPLRDRLEALGVATEVLPLDPDARDLRKESVTTRGAGWTAPLRSFQYAWLLRKRLRDLRPDLVHTNSLKASMYGGLAGRLAGIPVVWHVRDRIAPDYLPGAAVRLVRLASYVLPTAVVTNSRATAATLPDRGVNAVVPNAVIHDPVQAQPSTTHGPCRPFRVIVMGRLTPWKGQDVFLRAFASAFGGSLDHEAWIVGTAMFGEDRYEQVLRDLCADLGIANQVVFRGYRDDIWAELANVDVLVHCSVTPEPFGQVVVEGLAAGLPVIATSVGGPAEVITDGTDGLLIDPGDPAALAAAMIKLRDDPDLRRRLADAGLRTARRFAPETTAAELLAVYDRVLARRRSA